MSFRAVLLAVAVALPLTAAAQDRDATLADIRQELTVLSVELQKLKRELSTTGGVSNLPAGSGPLERLDGLETEVRRMTSKAEELENRINRVVDDGTNRISDLEFRLTELEGGDLGQLGETTPLGGENSAPAVAVPQPAPSNEPQLAMNEKSDFEAALGLVDKGTPADALAALTSFVDNYPRSPLAAEAQFYRGNALREVGDVANAGRAYLESFSLAENANPGLAADALFQLGRSLSDLGETREACVTLGQVKERYPDTAAAPRASERLGGMSCP
ncbi:tetratricopeptide repeat protein [Qingshengfaniella alkalisoli]|uniref:Cell division coordinator CpoB n=1 Tax=Qingshengfaniella alkalisoli TaxID=2599296 RepID=A0A5B8J4R6_9RHOB|nr:tetratricopeptide repeat protein [Qingshengfaniella alkalisoli]QDY69527.1 tetratricopeptide repeat protein [Qingshengfaniella alkalisoli]